MKSAITLHGLTLCYRQHPAVHHMSGEFLRGKATAIVGPNGAGKSTLLKGIAGLMEKDHGRIDFMPDINMAYLPQLTQLDCDFPMTVFELVLSGFWIKIRNQKGIGYAEKHKALQALEAVGLADFIDRNLDTLSGGQRQRALFARLIVQDANVILLDEPFTAMDERTTRDLTRLMMHWVAEGRTIIAVLHDLAQVQVHFTQCVLLARELVAWGDTASVLTEANWHKANHLAEGWMADAPVCLTEGTV
jgi:zinc/manganese transport system ATP-binding protein